MTDAVALSLLQIIPPTLAGIAAVVVAIRNGNITQGGITLQQQNHTELTGAVTTLSDNTNGKMDKLLQVTAQSEHAKGVLEQKEKDTGS
jgi:hypothetical protein